MSSAMNHVERFRAVTNLQEIDRLPRREFERLLPVIRSGGFIPSVDHQTPPDVSMEHYRIYLRLLDEYTS